MYACDASRRLDLVSRCVGTAERDVRAHRGGEQETVVEDDTDLAAQRGLGDVPDVLAVQTDRSGAHVVERETSASTVDLPEPEGPTRATVSPGAT